MAVFGVVLLRTTAWPLAPPLFARWDVLLPFIVYFGQRRSMAEGMILALFTSHLYSLCSAAPIGVFTAHYLLIFLIARLVSYVVFASTRLSIFVLLLCLSLASRAILPAVAAAFGHGWSPWAPGNISPIAVLWSALVGYVFYQLMGVLDAMTRKLPRASIELTEGSL